MSAPRFRQEARERKEDRLPLGALANLYGGKPAVEKANQLFPVARLVEVVDGAGSFPLALQDAAQVLGTLDLAERLKVVDRALERRLTPQARLWLTRIREAWARG